MLAVVLWTGALSQQPRRYWHQFAALSYLLPVPLIASIFCYGLTNCLFRLLRQNTLAFLVCVVLVHVVADLSVYGLVLVVVDRVCFKSGTRRFIHAAGFRGDRPDPPDSFTRSNGRCANMGHRLSSYALDIRR